MLKSLEETINVKFGSKRGMLKAFYYRLLTMSGFFRRYQQIEWRLVKRVVVVCHGNICRSPLGEIYIRSRGIDAVSYGVACTDNHPADPRAIAFAETNGLDLSKHKTQNIQHYQPVPGDLLVVMEPSHLEGIAPHIGSDTQVTMAGLWGSCSNAYLHDPFNTCGEFFNHCELMVSSGMESIIGNLKKAY